MGPICQPGPASVPLQVHCYPLICHRCCRRWATRKGLARLAVPRMPAFMAVGRREHWLDLDPRALREWASAPMAATLGLTAALQETRPGPGLPVRCLAADVMTAKDSLPHKTIYVGRGSFHHRQAVHHQVAIALDPWPQLRHIGMVG